MSNPGESAELPTSGSLTGGCLCGAIRYEAGTTRRDGYYCHCRMCQLAFGNTRAAFINVRKDEVTWTSGSPSHYASSAIARRGFCGRCGTPLSFDYLDSDNIDLSVGSLDHPEAVKPASHFAVESRLAGWHADDGLPGERLDQNETTVARWQKAYGDTVLPGVEAGKGAGDRP